MTIAEAISTRVSPYAIVGMNIDRKPKQKPSIEIIEEIVCRYYKTDPSILHQRCRQRHIIKVRQTIMYLCRKHTDESLKAIGAYFGNFDHTTVMHNARTAQNIIDTDLDYRAEVDFLNNYFKD